MVLALAFSLSLSLAQGAKPDTYTERWLCDLWAGAQCHATSCQKDGKERCLAVSKQCEATSQTAVVEPEKAQKRAACARALLKQACGAARPVECEGLL